MPDRRAKLLIVFAILLLIAAALWSRGAALAERPVAHDESLFGCFAYWLAENGVYEYDPMLHGPLLLEAQALIFNICGSDKWSMRLFPALCGLGLIAAMLLFRPWLGRGGVTAAMLLVLCSPTILFYSRFLRNDIPFLLASVLAVGCLGRGLGRRELIFLPLAIVCLALMACIKENTVFVLFTLCCYCCALIAVECWCAGKQLSPGSEQPPPPPLNQEEPPRMSMRKLLCQALPALGWTAALWGMILLFDQVFITEIAPDFRLAQLQLGDRPIGEGAAFVVVLISLVGSAFLIFIVLRLLARGERTGNLWTETKHYLWANRYLVGAGICAAWVLLTLVFSIGLGRPAPLIVLAQKTVAYWWEEHATQRLGGPFHYYWRLLVVYELPALLIVGAGMLQMILRERRLRLLALPVFMVLLLGTLTIGSAIDPKLSEQSWLALRYASLLELSHVNTLGNLLWATAVFYWGVCLPFSALAAERRFQAFAIIWLSVSLLCYSYAGEKAPWLVVHVTLPLIMLAAEQLAQLWRWLSQRRRSVIGQSIFLTGCLALFAWSGFLAWRTCLAEKDWPSEIIVHNHTTPEFEALAKRILQEAESANDDDSTEAFQASITGEAVWPMIWYLRNPNLTQLNWDPTLTPGDYWLVVDNVDDRTSAGLAVRASELFTHDEVILRTHWEFEYIKWDEEDEEEEQPFWKNIHAYTLGNRRHRSWAYVRYYFFREIPGDSTYQEQRADFSIMLHTNQATITR